MTSAPCSILVVTGEPSGEQHAAGVMRQLSRLCPGQSFEWFGTGGEQMAAEGAELLEDVRNLAAIGPWAAVSNILVYLRLFYRLLREARRRQPHLVLLVDFPDFNLRLAPRLKSLGLPICYFIGPQVWAWRPERVEKIRSCVDRMLVILPFEEAFYRKQGVEAVYVGNPSLQRLREGAQRADKQTVRRSFFRVALLPGSRSKEISHILPVQLEAAWQLSRELPCRFWLVRAESCEKTSLEKGVERWQRLSEKSISLEIRDEGTARILPQVDCAIIKSGTSTLEAMILGVPFAMVYRMAGLSYRLLRPRVATETFCLANWVAGEKIVPEFVQGDARPEAIAGYLKELLESPEKLDRVKQNLRIASERLGDGDAYLEAAHQMNGMLKDLRN